MPVQPIYNEQPYLTLSQYFTTSADYPFSSISGATLAQVRTFAGNFAPNDNVFAQGQQLSISLNSTLFSLVGTTFGGDAMTTFGVPDLGGRVLIGDGQGSGLLNYTLGEEVGQAEVSLTENEVPTSIGGNGGAFDNHQPSLAVNYIIQTFGSGAQDAAGVITAYVGANTGDAMECDGRSLAVADYPELFAAIGTLYGGDGVTTFNIPDLRGRTLVGDGQGPGLTNHAAGSSFGSEEVTLTAENVPAAGIPAAQPFDNFQPSVAVNFLIATEGIFPQRGSSQISQSDAVIGEIIAFAGAQPNLDSWPFRGFMECNGQLLSIAQNTALFSILGTTYGGDGRVTFALPDLRGRSIVGADAAGNYSLGQASGQQQNYVLASSLPSIALDDAFAIDDTGTLVAASLFADNGSGADSGSNAVTHVNGVALVSGAQITLASGALLTQKANGSFDYNPNGKFEHLPMSASGSDGPYSATDSFTYTITGGDTATVTITLTGIDNDDRLIATNAVNQFDGGSGNNRVTYENASGAVTVDLRDDTGAANVGDALNDTYTAIESYILSSHDDTFLGSSTPGASNVAFGFDGADRFVAGGPGTTNEFFGQAGGDTFTGSAGDTRAFGGIGDDAYNAGTGVDRFWGQDGADTFHGGTGDDFASGGEQNDHLHGEEDNDQLLGGAGHDELYGDLGNDQLRGNADSDVLVGGGGNDQLRGDGGSDTFMFDNIDTGLDTVRDFELGSDQLQFIGLTIDDLTITVVNNFTKILIEPSGAVIKVLGVTDSVALQDDMIFGLLS